MTLLTTAFAQGTHAARPAAAAGNAGYYYFETDTTNLFQSTGSTWTQVASVGGGGGGGGIVQASQVSLTSGDLLTSSTTFVDATGLTTTITTGAHRCLVTFTGSGNNPANQNVAVDLAIDGTRQGQTYGLQLFGQTSNTANGSLAFTYLTAALTAASHTFKIQWRVDGGANGKLWASTTAPAILTVIELGI